MKVYVDAYLAKNLGDDLFVDILTKRYPNHSFTAISKIKYKYYSKNLQSIFVKIASILSEKHNDKIKDCLKIGSTDRRFLKRINDN